MRGLEAFSETSHAQYGQMVEAMHAVRDAFYGDQSVAEGAIRVW